MDRDGQKGSVGAATHGRAMRLLPILLALLACLGVEGSAAADQLGDEDYIYAAQRELIGIHGYQPIFNGLKFRDGPWQERIVTEHGARFFTPAAVRDSFLFIIDPPPEGEAGRTVDREQVRHFCAANLGAAPGGDSAHRRLAGLCALADCRLVGAGQWAGLARSTDFGAARRTIDGGERDRQDAEDAAFLFRVAALCGEAGPARAFAAALTDFSRFILQLRAECGRRQCSDLAGGENEKIRRSLGTDMHLLLAATESDLLPPELAAAAASGWLGNRAVVPPPDEATDPDVAETCERAMIDAAKCRIDFPHSYFLERQYLRMIARLFVSAGAGADPCLPIASFRAYFEREIGYRFATPPPPGTRLRFAPRCL
jgi:hypothetical protein